MDYSEAVQQYRQFLRAVVSDYPERYREDLTQEGLVGLYHGVCRFDPARGVFDAFIKECIRNAVRTGFRRFEGDSRMEQMNDEMQLPAEEIPFEERLAESDSVRALFTRLRDDLTDLEARVLDLYLEGNTSSVIAARLGVTPKSADNAMTRVRQKLRKAVNSDC